MRLDTLNDLRRFLTPIPDEALPGLAPRITRSGRTAVKFAIFIGLFVRTADVLRSRTEIGPTLLFQAIVFCVLVPLLFVGASAWGRRRPDLLVSVVGIDGIVEMAAMGLLYGNTNPVLPYLPLVPMTFALLAPSHPITQIGHGILGAIISFAVGWGSLGLPRPELELRVIICIVFGVVAAVGVQVHRQHWRQMELAQAKGRLVAADRLAYMARLGGALAHELKTPLATASNYLRVASTLLSEMTESIGHPDVNDEDLRQINTEIARSVEGADKSVNRTARTIQAMRESTRVNVPTSLGGFTIGSRVEMVHSLLEERLRAGVFRIETKNLDIVLHGNAIQFDVVITNLLRNALDAMSASQQGSTVRVTAEKRQNGVLILIEDDGPGVPEALRERIFEQSFTTKYNDEGLGLGLWICRNIVVSMFMGSLTLATKGVTPRGARFEVWIPEQNISTHEG